MAISAVQARGALERPQARQGSEQKRGSVKAMRKVAATGHVAA